MTGRTLPRGSVELELPALHCWAAGVAVASPSTALAGRDVCRCAASSIVPSGARRR